MRNGFLWALAGAVATFGLASAEEPAEGARLGFVPISEETAPKRPAMPAIADAACCRPEEPCRRVWVGADYLLWWVRGGPLSTPLLTTGPVTDIPPGALGQPGTQVLFGDRPIGYDAISGVRVNLGADLGPCWSFEGNYFILTNGAAHFRAASDANGDPLIARPFFNDQLKLQDALGVSTSDPRFGPYAGSTTIASHSQLQGFELNLAGRNSTSQCWSVSPLIGFRFLHLREDLTITDDLTPLAPGIFLFLGQPVDPPSTISDTDSFRTRNAFYGGQLGGRLQWTNGRASVNVLGKVALGVTHQSVTIDGSSTLLTPGAAPVVAPGGVLAVASNIGHYSRSQFSLAPEVGVNLGWSLTPRLKTTVGYNFLYWTQVARPGSQIDPTLNPALQPTNQNFGNGFGGARPAFTFRDSDFWAQGLSFGLEFSF